MSTGYTYDPNRKPEELALLPEGAVVLGRVADWGKTTAQSSGNEMIELTWKVDGAPKIFDNLVFTEAAFWKIDQFLAAAHKAPPPGQAPEFNSDLLDGTRAWLKVGVKEYQPKNSKDKKKCNVIREYVIKDLPPEDFD